jgi:cell wall assembly regulator SMI1
VGRGLTVEDSRRRIDHGLAKLQRARTIELLRPGTTAQRVTETLERTGLSCANDLVSLYEWHDGTDATTGATLDDLHLFPGYYLLTLDDAAANYKAFKNDERWDRDWFPILANGGGDFYAVVCSEGGQDRGRVLHFRLEDTDRSVEFSSVSQLLATLAAGYDEGVFFVDDRGYLEMQDTLFAALAKRLTYTQNG